MDCPQISIIVPVYKAEKYIDRCIKSIINQTLEDWELILVDDGSPDKSGEICNQYAKSEKRIKVIHKRNEGVASAREIGIQKATGEYSIHIDPDDWIDSSTLEELYQKAKTTNADMVICDLALEYHSRTEILCQEIDSAERLLTQLFFQEKHGSLCNKLIRTALYKQYNLHFPSQLICWEDLYICCNILMLHPCKVEYIHKAFYHYDFFSNPNSMARKASIKTLEGMEFFCHYFDNKLPKEKKHWLNETKGIVLVTAYRCQLLDAKEIRQLFPEINQWYISKYLHDYTHLPYCCVARILNGKSIKDTLRFQKRNALYQRIINKIKRIF